MLIFQISINFTLFVLAFLGTILNYNNVLKTLIGIEVMLLCANLNFASFSIYLDDIYGQLLCIFILTIAAAESAIGLALLILLYKARGSILISEESCIKS
jgi:NADH-quinone oxidoreductase subunit K